MIDGQMDKGWKLCVYACDLRGKTGICNESKPELKKKFLPRQLGNNLSLRLIVNTVRGRWEYY